MVEFHISATVQFSRIGWNHSCAAAGGLSLHLLSKKYELANCQHDSCVMPQPGALPTNYPHLVRNLRVTAFKNHNFNANSVLFVLFIVTETDTVPWVDWSGANCWRWIWRHTLCETSWVGNSCLQGTEIFNHCWWLKVWQTLIMTNVLHRLPVYSDISVT